MPPRYRWHRDFDQPLIGTLLLYNHAVKPPQQVGNLHYDQRPDGRGYGWTACTLFPLIMRRAFYPYQYQAKAWLLAEIEVQANTPA